eukprot:scaffold1474_cov132-Cylindrotheca_fusiformis.AAC.13
MPSTESESKSIPKACELLRWNPYKVVSTVDKAKEEQYLELPGYSSCRLIENAVDLVDEDMSAEIRRFINKLRRKETIAALSMIATFDEVLHRKADVCWDDLDTHSLDNNNSISLLDDNSLLVEAWPLIQHQITWSSFVTLHQLIESRLCLVTLPHPLEEYAKKTVFQIDDIENAIAIAIRYKWISPASKNRLRFSQLLLDYVASVPPRVVGVLLEDPSSLSQLSPLPQSCLPLACLELSLAENDELVCQMISLYQLEPDEVYTVSTRRPTEECSCFKCSFEQQPPGSGKGITRKWAMMAQRLAHVYFQEEKYENAKILYKQCFSYFAETMNDQEKAADLWHSIAAVLLTELKFIEAQKHWEKGSRFASSHNGIALQIKKQAAYRYFHPNDSDTNLKVLPPYETIGKSRKFFVTANAVSQSTCRQLIALAKEYALKQGGWTTSRHYAVPTTDIPVHEAPKLLDWFVPWFKNDVTSLLQAQFETKKQFYVHDAFLVRYSACSSSHFLPLHFDESTHSLVLALNSDFEGGGTYFYDMDHTSIPKCGSLVSFRGNQLLHGGNVVTKGERFILAIFLYADSDRDKKDDSEGTAPGPKRLKTENEFSFRFF